MSQEFVNYTNYDKAVDIKRLKFVTETLGASIPDGGKVLDVGCGNGNISIQLGKIGYKVDGIDISAKAIEVARSKNDMKNVTFEVIPAEELLADGRMYDAVICSEVLEHLDDPGILLKTIYKLLKPSGRLIVTVPNGKGPRETIITKPMQKMQNGDSPMLQLVLGFKKVLGYSGTTIQSAADDLTHVQFFTATALRKLANDNSFEIIQWGTADFLADVFPVSLFTRRIRALQDVDVAIANVLPASFSSGFNMVWKKK